MALIYYRADFRGANFNSAKLHGSDLRNARGQASDFRNAGLADVNFEKANLSGAILEGVTLVGQNVILAKLTWASLQPSPSEDSDIGLNKILEDINDKKIRERVRNSLEKLKSKGDHGKFDYSTYTDPSGRPEKLNGKGNLAIALGILRQAQFEAQSLSVFELGSDPWSDLQTSLGDEKNCGAIAQTIRNHASHW
jgi:uncharacterized protein YjbI with pentapeptide repeats